MRIRTLFQEDTGTSYYHYWETRWWIWAVMWTGVIFGLAWFGFWIYGELTGPSCGYPYHLVYTGWNWELVGKVMARVDQYACVPN